jgi:hypothetical protein
MADLKLTQPNFIDFSENGGEFALKTADSLSLFLFYRENFGLCVDRVEILMYNNIASLST